MSLFSGVPLSAELLPFFPLALRLHLSLTARVEGRGKEHLPAWLALAHPPQRSLISIKPREGPKGGSCPEESSGVGDSSSALGGDSLVMVPLGAVLLVMCLTGMAGNIYAVLVASGKVAGPSAASLGVCLINLALADLLYLSTIPFVVCTYFAHSWYFGDVGCRQAFAQPGPPHHACQHLPSDHHEPGEVLGSGQAAAGQTGWQCLLQAGQCHG